MSKKKKKSTKKLNKYERKTLLISALIDLLVGLVLIIIQKIID